jgi:cell division protein FtsN
MPSNIQFDLDYIWYHKDQTAINFNYLEERKVSASVPFRIGKFSSFNRFSVNQLILPQSRYTTGEWMFSGSLYGVNTNITTYGMFIGDIKPYFYSNISISGRLPGRFVLMSQAQYGISENKILSAKLKVEKYLLEHAFVNVSYERNFTYSINMLELGMRYDFSFARTGLSFRQSGNKSTFIEHASGSLVSDSKEGFIVPDNRPNVGRGGVTVIPFFDLNVNGVLDNGEQKVPGLNIRANGGRIIQSEKDTTIRIVGLEPYTSCFIELDPNSFENISWQLAFRTVSVNVDANMLKPVYVPVNVAGEANGTVTLDDKGAKTGQGRVIVNFFTGRMKYAGRTLTENDGYFSLFGLSPGDYIVMVDTAQLRRLEMTSEPDSIAFSVKANLDGDIVDGLDFNLKKIVKVTKEVLPEVPVVQVVSKDTSYFIVHEVVEELVTISEDCWAIQLGAFRQKRNAEAMRRKLEQIFGQKVDIVVADNFYKVRINDIKTRAEVDQKIEVLRKNGITELWVITLKAKQQQRILVDRADSVAVIRDITDTTGVQPVPALMSIQIGAFRSNNYAIALRNRMASLINNPVEIIVEDGYYKVRITGFTNRLDMERLLPSLGMMGLRDLWVPPVKTPEPVVKPVVVPVDTARTKVGVPPADTIRNAPVVVLEIAPEVKPEQKAAEIPPVSMRVGEFIKKSQALKAQRKVSRTLGLESEIVERWGYYYIIIGGFYTREETYQYYPELAGIGLTRIMIIDTR